MLTKVGITFGTFDLFHAGHNVMLKECKDWCDYLIIGLHTDPTIDRPEKNKPIQTIYERYVQLDNCKWVDQIIPYDTEKDLLNLLATVQFDIRFIGADYINKDFTGKQYCLDRNIPIKYCSRDHTFSSSELRKRIESGSILR
jgi:glycerol-3-phosphate cytidylyltransferase